jgi:hypothetical protein
MVSAANTTHRYRVKVGHIEVVVVAHDEAEAITLTRRHLAAELPRFYDLIRALGPERFELKEAA